jgi:tetraacyldisaccharide 4'-kinase
MISPDYLNRLWYEDHSLSRVLLPVSWVYGSYVWLRRFCYTTGILPRRSVNVPVIVAGNITVGGTGKTPLIIWLANTLKLQGHRPGIISRGYGGNTGNRPQQVRPDSEPGLVGDEPVLIAQRTGCPVAVSPNRYRAAMELLQFTDCDVLLCDDGLQHLSMHRDLEIAVIDGDRRFGNGRCLPAGPLREPLDRLRSVDMVVSKEKAGKNEFLMQYEYEDLRSLQSGAAASIEKFRGRDVHVVSGIGNPARFHTYLRSHDIRMIRHDFPDHHRYTAADLRFDDNLPIVMTEKDAVKCQRFARDNMWYLPIQPRFTEAFHHRLSILLKEIFDG